MAPVHPSAVVPVPGGATEQLWSSAMFRCVIRRFFRGHKREVKRKVVLRRVVGCFFAARCLIFFGMTWFWDGCFFLGGGPSSGQLVTKYY